MIQRVSFTNFKSLRRVDADLGRFMVIVGPNGSGKTSILDGLHYLAQASAPTSIASFLKDDFAPQNLKTRGREGPMKLSLSGLFQGVQAGVEISIDGDGASWKATITRRWGEVAHERTEHIPPLPPPLRPRAARVAKPGLVATLLPRPVPSEMTTLARQLGSVKKLRLDIEKLSAPSYSEDETPHLNIDGQGLASVLADAVGRTPEVFQAIQDAARQIIPTLERIRTRRAKVHRVEDKDVWGQQLVLDFKGAPDVPAPLASEGTLLVIGLLTALHMEPRPRLLLLDDIDKTLHPRAQGDLIAQLGKVLEMDPALQIIATSHSPYLLDHFDAKDVLLTALDPEGSTTCALLSDHPDYNRWKNTTKAGELWSFVGEDWIAQRASAGGRR